MQEFIVAPWNNTLSKLVLDSNSIYVRKSVIGYWLLVKVVDSVVMVT